GRVAYLVAEGQVVGVGGTQGVAVHQQGTPAMAVDQERVIDQGTAAASAKAGTEQKVAVAVHDPYRADGGQCSQAFAYRGGQRAVVVIADPGLKQVAEDVQGARRARLA